ncbi:MAG: hypothetical protein LBE12_08365 [Planctomycetaceae bacterium]|jgi:predicted GH43/DUF377 family glycosyl hydrolase|nr:hypothetical protein [Planctomycetaceae bacterium]
MRLFYALYDPAFPVDGDYWSWSAEEIVVLKAEQNRFYGDFAVKHLPPNPNKLLPSDLWGGIVRLPNFDWTVVYRFLDGGYDDRGRPGHYVIMTAWVKTADTTKKDLSPIFNSLIFKQANDHAKKIPVPKPNFLTEKFDGQPVTCPQDEINQLLQTKEISKEISFLQDDVVSSATKLFANIPLIDELDSLQIEPIECADVRIEKTSEQNKAVVRIKFQPKPKIESPEPISNPKLKPVEGCSSTPTPNLSLLKLLKIISEKYRKLLTFLIVCMLVVAGLFIFYTRYYSPASKPRNHTDTQRIVQESSHQQIKEIFSKLPIETKQNLLIELQTDLFLESTGIIDAATLEKWSNPYRDWHLYSDSIIPSDYKIPDAPGFKNYNYPSVYQLEGKPNIWYMAFIGYNNNGYNSFVVESHDLVHWNNPKLAIEFRKQGESDHGSCVIGAFLYNNWDIKSPRTLKKKDDQYWTLYGCYPNQGGYKLRSGYEGVAVSNDGMTWTRTSDPQILSTNQNDRKTWEKDGIYQPWLLEHEGTYYNFYNAANGNIEQIGLALSNDLIHWVRYPSNPILKNRPNGYDAQICSDGKVFRDGDHWTMFYIGVGKDGASIMIAFSRDLLKWTAAPEPLYKFNEHQTNLNKESVHKISLVYNPKNKTFYMFYSTTGNKGRTIGLLTSKKISESQK